MQLGLVSGTKYDGTWQGVWRAHDTLEIYYTSVIRAESESGEVGERELIWKDFNCVAIPSGNFSSSIETTNVTYLCVGINNQNFSNVVLGANSLVGKIIFKQDLILNSTHNFDNAIIINSSLVRVNSTLYPSLNVSANIVVRGLKLGYPQIFKDGVPCADCTILRWDKSVGEVMFNVSGFSDYTWAEANQSKVQNNGTNNISFYLLMKTERWNNGWVLEDVVVNDSASGTLRTVNTSSLLKFDAIWNAQAYNSSNLSGGDGTYRVYAALTDLSGNVLRDNTGANLSAAFNFTLDNSVPSSVTLNAPANNSLFGNNANNVSFNWTVIDSMDSSLTCNLTIDSVVRAINVLTLNGTMTNYTVNNVAVGNHWWNVTCWDDAMNTNISATFNLSIYAVDNLYPTFSNYWDNNASLVGSGVARFNVTVTNTNGTVFLEINNTNYTATANYPTYLCYQETANQSSVGDGNCGLNYGGSYGSSGTWYNLNNTYDGNWSSLGFGSACDSNFLYINYSKPDNALSSSFWMEKYYYGTTNRTIPSQCFNQNVLQFRLDSYVVCEAAPSFIQLDCFNGTGWQLIGTDSSSNSIYEEAMIWNISNVSSPGNYNVSVSLTANGTYSYYWGAWGNGTSHNYNVSGMRSYTVNSGVSSLTDCGTLGVANTVYTLQNNVTSNSTCFTITANNVTLNGNGYSINYSANGTLGYGVNVTGWNFTTVKNARIVEGTSTTSSKHGIYYRYF